MRGGDISHFGFLPPVRFSVPCFRGYYWPWIMHTTMFLGYACKRLGTYFNLLVWIGTWRVVEHVNDWCFHDIYKGGL